MFKKIAIAMSISFFLSCAFCAAQKNVLVYASNLDSVPVPFYTIENIRNPSEKIIADSLGKAILPAINGFSYKLHAIGYRDTIFTFLNEKKITIHLSSANLLKEIEITSKKLSNANVIKAKRANVTKNWPPFSNVAYNHEIGRLVSFPKYVWLQSVSFKLRSKYELDFKKHVFLNIYKITDSMQKGIDEIALKKPGFYSVATPQMIFSGRINNSYGLKFRDDTLIFETAAQQIILEPGNYIFTLELSQATTSGIYTYFAQEKECHTLRSNNNSKTVAWFTEIKDGKYLNIIADVTYKQFEE